MDRTGGVDNQRLTLTRGGDTAATSTQKGTVGTNAARA
jgi:hypothetical protein